MKSMIVTNPVVTEDTVTVLVEHPQSSDEETVIEGVYMDSIDDHATIYISDVAALEDVL